MKILCTMPKLKGYCFPREIVAYAVWAYHRFALSTADVEDLLSERGVMALPRGLPTYFQLYERGEGSACQAVISAV